MPASPRIVVSEARIVHEQINASVAPHHFADSGFHGFIAGHVEGQNFKWPLARLGSPSAGAVNLVACLCEPLCRGLTDPRRGAGNERDLSFALSHELPLTTAPIAIVAPRTNTSRVAGTRVLERIWMTIAMFTTDDDRHIIVKTLC